MKLIDKVAIVTGAGGVAPAARSPVALRARELQW